MSNSEKPKKFAKILYEEMPKIEDLEERIIFFKKIFDEQEMKMFNMNKWFFDYLFGSGDINHYRSLAIKFFKQTNIELKSKVTKRNQRIFKFKIRYSSKDIDNLSNYAINLIENEIKDKDESKREDIAINYINETMKQHEISLSKNDLLIVKERVMESIS